MIEHSELLEIAALPILVYDYAKRFMLNKDETVEEFLNSKGVFKAAAFIVCAIVLTKAIGAVSIPAAITVATASLHMTMYTVYVRLFPLIASKETLNELNHDINFHLKQIRRLGRDAEGFPVERKVSEPPDLEKALSNTRKRLAKWQKEQRKAAGAAIRAKRKQRSKEE